MSKKRLPDNQPPHPLKEKNNRWIDWKSKIIGNAWSLESSVDKSPFKKMEISEIKLGPIWDGRTIMIPLQLKKNISGRGFFWGLEQKYKAFFCVYLRNAEKKGTRMMGFL